MVIVTPTVLSPMSATLVRFIFLFSWCSQIFTFCWNINKLLESKQTYVIIDTNDQNMYIHKYNINNLSVSTIKYFKIVCNWHFICASLFLFYRVRSAPPVGYVCGHILLLTPPLFICDVHLPHKSKYCFFYRIRFSFCHSKCIITRHTNIRDIFVIVALLHAKCNCNLKIGKYCSTQALPVIASWAV